MTKKAQVGDIFEIVTPNGRGYIQCIGRHHSRGELIRVLRPLLEERPPQFGDMTRQPERFLTYFPLTAAKSRGIVQWVGNEDVPPNPRVPPAMRSPGKINPHRRVVESWWIIEGDREVLVESLTDEQKKLSINAVINDTLLIEHLVTDWSPTDYT
jgi:hypothetical protein